MGKSSGSAKMEVTDYYMSVHMGICHGPVDAITGIYIGEKVAWEGEATTTQTIDINKPDLFGGVKKEGGAVGNVVFSPGPIGSGNLIHANLAARMGRTQATTPAYNGMAYLFFIGNIMSTVGAFLWGSNSPYLKSVWVRVRRRSNAFPAKAGEPSNYADMGTESNPAHMVYECLTNTEWGMGASEDIIDVSSFQDCAKTFYNEGFGLSMLWTRQSTIENFIKEIIDHVQATVFVNPQTGLLTIKAIRGDYNSALLPVLDPTNCTVTQFQRRLWGETINEINISWTNPANEQEETYTIHDLANIEIQGSIVSDTRNYYGVRSGELAAYVAARDIRSAAAPLATFEIEADRTMYFLLPGGVAKINYPELNIEEVIIRIVDIDYGRPGDSKIKIKATEDIFGLPQSTYTAPDGSGWVDVSYDPTVLDSLKIFTLPAYFASKVATDNAVAALAYPEVFMGVLPVTTNRDARSIELYGETVLPNGTVEMDLMGTKSIIPEVSLQVTLTAQVSTTLTAAQLGLAYITAGTVPKTNSFAFIGDGSDEEVEIALVSSVALDYSSITLKRGVLDTIPRAWPFGTRIRFVNPESVIGDAQIFSDGSTLSLKALMTTSKGTLPLSSSPIYTGDLNGRPHLPTRPANVTVGGVAFGTYYTESTSAITVTWATRNRTTEDSQIILWTDGDVTPESGQTTTVTVMDMDRNVITTHNGLTGSSFSLPYASFGGRAAGIVKVTAKRDGLESLQGHEIVVGFGHGYGMDYGKRYGAV